jgi:hypothetical protein
MQLVFLLANWGLSPMMRLVIMQILATVLACLWVWRKTDHENDLEILLLRHQLDMVDRALGKP